MALSVLSASIGGRLVVSTGKGYEQPAIFSVVSILPSGARKTEVFRRFTRPLEDFQRRLVKEGRPQREENRSLRRAAEIRRSSAEKALGTAKSQKDESAEESKDESKKKPTPEEALKQALEELEKIPIPADPCLVLDDATPEAMLETMAENGGRVSLMDSEGDAFVTATSRYQNKGVGFFQLLKKGYDADSIHSRRKSGSPIDIDRGCLTVAVTVQPEFFQDLGQKRQLEGQGVFARFALVKPLDSPGGFSYRDTSPPLAHIEERWAEGVQRLAQSGYPADCDGREPTPFRLILSPEALDLWQAFGDEVQTLIRHGSLESIRPWGEKLAGRALRIAGLLTIAQRAGEVDDDAVSADAMKTAIRISTAFISHASAAYAVLHLDPKLAVCQYVLRKAIQWADDEGVISVRDLFDRAREKPEIKNVDDLRELLAELERRDHLRVGGGESMGGRPSIPVTLHPCYMRSRDRADTPANTQKPLVRIVLRGLRGQMATGKPQIHRLPSPLSGTATQT